MTHNPEEFIGMELQVKSAKNKSLIGTRGIIIDESKKTFTIKTTRNAGGQAKTILKNGCTFIINGKVIDGKVIEMRPEERIKSR